MQRGHRLAQLTVVGTGGTIAGSAAAAADFSYRAAVVEVGDLLSAVPALGDIAHIRYEQFCQLDSVDMDLPTALGLARRVNELLAGDDCDGVVITHGTDTMEETAFVLHLTVSSAKPVVLTGSMRPSDAVSADGPANLLAAARVAGERQAHGRGVLVVLNDEIHSARDVCKTEMTRLDAFSSPFGPLGLVAGDGVHWVRSATGAHTTASPVPVPRGSLSRVDVIDTAYGPDVSAVEAQLRRLRAVGGSAGVVLVGPGDGNIPNSVRDLVREATADGVVVVRASRVSGGAVTRNGDVSDDELGTCSGADLSAGRLRILLALALATGADARSVQALIDAVSGR